MRDVIGIRYFQSTLGIVQHKLWLFFGLRLELGIRISFRVRVLGNSDHCVLKFNSVLRY